MFRKNDDNSYHLVGVNSFVFSITDDDLPCSQGGTGSIRIDLYAQWIADEMNVDFESLFIDIPEVDTEIPTQECTTDEDCDPQKYCSQGECIEIVDTGEDTIPKSGCQNSNIGSEEIWYTAILFCLLRSTPFVR
jgi:hypothetical protein